ncbi:MAG TPA: stimulus-sensing domain-containing protein [Luteitalea sp.]|nr:stimulus-sensing domain-containing protein [Luteitalea sp.]
MTKARWPLRAWRVLRYWRGRISRIGLRLLLFNVLAAIMPVAGILYLDVYEQELLLAQERGMVQQARIVAAALATAPVAGAALDADAARRLLARVTPGDARIRVYDVNATLVADSARLSPRGEATPAPSYDQVGVGTRDEWLYRLGSWLAQWRRRAADLLRPRMTVPDGAVPVPASGLPEVRTALGGRFGAATRPTPGQRSLTLTVALPVGDATGVAGAVTVSQSTYRILQALYTIRLRIFRIIVATLALSAAISGLLGVTIVVPIRRLRRAALSLARGERRVPTHFPGVDRRDEMGDLARALEEVTRRLQAHVTLLESFAGDVAHEFRNPLASIRTALDVVQDTADPLERERFLQMARRDIDRLDRLVVGVRDLARIDSAIEREDLEWVDLTALVSGLLAHRHPTLPLASTSAAPIHVRAQPDRLLQVAENLVDNAVSFSPQPESVVVRLRKDGDAAVLTVEDRGPGIPPAHRERVFERFFSYRPGSATARHEHAGLGLAIARAIVEAYGGVITVGDRDGGGAKFEVRLPLVR